MIEVLQITKAHTKANQIQVAAGVTTRSKQKKYRNIDNRLAILKDRFLNQQMRAQYNADQNKAKKITLL